MPTRTLDALLAAIRPRPDDTIVTLGDYINRGPDSRGVIDRLIELGRRCRLVSLLGNHDQMLLEARAGIHPTTWLGMGGIATLDSYGPGRDMTCQGGAHEAIGGGGRIGRVGVAGSILSHPGHCERSAKRNPRQLAGGLGSGSGSWWR
jgi:hypothetical protein